MKIVYLQPPKAIQPLFRKPYNVFKRKPIDLSSKPQRWRKVARLVNLSPEALTRLEWIIFYYTVAGQNAKMTAEHFGISRNCLHKWLKRFKESKENVKSLETQSKRPKRVRSWQVTLTEEARIIKIRQAHLYWGKRKLKVIYEKRYKKNISCWKIERVIKKHQLYPDQKKATKIALKIKKAKEKPKRRITELAIEPQLWFLIHVDCLVIYWGNLKRYILTAIDHYGRFGYARMYKTKSSRIGKDFLYRLHYLFQQKIINIQTDNGSEFAGEFAQALDELKILHWFSRVKTPQDNAPIERFHKTLQYEWLNDGNFTENCHKFNKNLTQWLIEYNFQRPHQSLNYLTPIEFIQKEMLKPNQKVSPMYPARTKT